MSLRVVPIALIAACGGGGKDSGGGPVLDETEYLEQYPSAFCEVLAECDAENFEQAYGGDLQSCVDEITSVGRDRINRGCAFDGAAAGTCVSELSEASCAAWDAGEYQESCGAIIDC